MASRLENRAKAWVDHVIGPKRENQYFDDHVKMLEGQFVEVEEEVFQALSKAIVVENMLPPNVHERLLQRARAAFLGEDPPEANVAKAESGTLRGDAECRGVPDCHCYHCKEVRANARKEIAAWLRSQSGWVTTKYGILDLTGVQNWFADVIERGP